ncbi:hypothetical protein OCS_04182 [Ophiocordyceps sinensis CO18]|uniref:Uncharacterized protein n=1 Tax=Ophiocordyceps sinensis (strain Co18 / CGMCC 3.14243) TaxID=911162 RepID=T5AC03_OPHSC|nr:hypothetical protein OCS_04182 [Ophiocordyceps sinensis CO18]
MERMRHDGHEPLTEAPPPYDDIVFSRGGRGAGQARASIPWWNPRYWRKRAWIELATVAAVAVIIVVAVAVVESKKNAYPDYAPIAYGLSDRCKWTTASRFNYFTGYDAGETPADSVVSGAARAD